MVRGSVLPPTQPREVSHPCQCALFHSVHRHPQMLYNQTTLYCLSTSYIIRENLMRKYVDLKSSILDTVAKLGCFAHEQLSLPLSRVNPRQTVWWKNIDEHEVQEFHHQAWKQHSSSFHLTCCTYFSSLLSTPTYTSFLCYIVFFTYQCQRQITLQPWGWVKLI